MDRILRRELDAIVRDRSSGAAELTLRATYALLRWVKQNKHLEQAEVLSVAAQLLTCHPLMAPLLRLANEVALGAEAPHPRRAIGSRLARIRRIVQRAPQRIATLFLREIQRKRICSVCTYSYSSTVLGAILRARKTIRMLICSEARPAFEGRVLATRAAACGMLVRLATDAELLSNVHRGAYQVLILGADSIRSRFFVNKIGSNILVRNAWENGTPVWLLADTLKFWDQPVFPAQAKRLHRPAPKDTWPGAPDGVNVSDLVFDTTLYPPNLRILTERGWMRPAQVRRELKKIHVSPRLAHLLD